MANLLIDINIYLILQMVNYNKYNKYIYYENF